MSRLSQIPNESLQTILPKQPEALCPICDQLVSLELAKTDECGRAIHEECYVLKLKLERASC